MKVPQEIVNKLHTKILHDLSDESFKVCNKIIVCLDSAFLQEKVVSACYGQTGYKCFFSLFPTIISSYLQKLSLLVIVTFFSLYDSKDTQTSLSYFYLFLSFFLLFMKKFTLLDKVFFASKNLINQVFFIVRKI